MDITAPATTSWIQSIQAAHQELALSEPRSSLIVHPSNKDGSTGSIEAASVVLFTREAANVRILMVQEKWKQDALALPGGNRALNKSKWDHFTDTQVRHEEFFPLLTAAREAHEELPWLFKTIQTAYELLNTPETIAVKNTGWETFPVVNYVRELPEVLCAQIASDLGHVNVKTDEVSGVALVALSDLEHAWQSAGWTAAGLDERQRRIDAAPKGEKADLTDLPFDVDLAVAGGFTMKAYVARSLFTNMERIRGVITSLPTVNCEALKRIAAIRTPSYMDQQNDYSLKGIQRVTKQHHAEFKRVIKDVLDAIEGAEKIPAVRQAVILKCAELEEQQEIRTLAEEVVDTLSLTMSDDRELLLKCFVILCNDDSGTEKEQQQRFDSHFRFMKYSCDDPDECMESVGSIVKGALEGKDTGLTTLGRQVAEKLLSAIAGDTDSSE